MDREEEKKEEDTDGEIKTGTNSTSLRPAAPTDQEETRASARPARRHLNVTTRAKSIVLKPAEQLTDAKVKCEPIIIWHHLMCC